MTALPVSNWHDSKRFLELLLRIVRNSVMSS